MYLVSNNYLVGRSVEPSRKKDSRREGGGGGQADGGRGGGQRRRGWAGREGRLTGKKDVERGVEVEGGWGVGGRLVPTTTGSPIIQPEALYCNRAWIWAKPETTVSQPANKLRFCNILHGFQSDGQPLRKHIQF